MNTRNAIAIFLAFLATVGIGCLAGRLDERRGAGSRTDSAGRSSVSSIESPLYTGEAPVLARASAPPPVPRAVYSDLMDYFWELESSQGRNPASQPGVVGLAGERGEYQITPIFIRDCRRFGIELDPYDNDQCRTVIPMWLERYRGDIGIDEGDKLWQLYRRGPTGYRKWIRSK